MRIHGLMLVKDEVDVIEETLESAARWCDAIYVFDNGSRDGTWERVQELSQACPQVIPYRQDAAPFSQALRGEIFRHYRSRAADGDWWCVLDADEIYIDDPRAFLERVPARYGEVWGSSFQYYFTDADLARYEADPADFHHTPVRERLRYYLNNWSESRFMRHHRGLVWPEGADGRPVGKRPVGLRPTYPTRIRLRHYQYRSPEQIERRLSHRGASSASHRHEQQRDWLRGVLRDPNLVLPPASPGDMPSWRDRVVPASLLHYDAGDGRYIEGTNLPPLPLDRLGLRDLKHRAASARWRLTAWVRGVGDTRPSARDHDRGDASTVVHRRG